MEAKTWASVTPSKDKKTVVLSADGIENNLRFLGTSLTASVSQGQEVNSVAIGCLGEESEGIVAFALKLNHGWIATIAPVSKKDEAHYIDLKFPWVPLHDRLTQAYSDHLEVMVGDKTFSSRRESGKPGYRYVPDANLLCRFAFGKIELKDLEKAAEETVAEESARVQLAKAKEDIREYNRRIPEYVKLIDEEHEKVLALEKQVAELDKLRPRYEAALNLADAVGAKWHFGKRRIVKDALAHFYRKCD